MSLATRLRSTGAASSFCRRLNARSWRVSARGALGGVLDFDDRRPHLGMVLQLQREELGVAEDDRHDVVEVVRDAAGEPADRLHLLRLPVLFLELGLRAQLVAQDRRSGGPPAAAAAARR